MPDTMPTNSPIVAAYRQKTPGSARLSETAGAIFPSGITHDSRKLDPYPVYIERAQGSRKWDVDGNEYVDYYGGHGALILGHNHPAVREAAARQLALGTHYGACHALEVRWGELVRDMVPSAEKVRFFSSGTEANLMALRLARAFTGKPRIMRFHRHFHGWQDHVAFGVSNHFDGSASAGVLDGIAENVILADSGDIAATREILETDDTIAAVILEPTGASSGQVPLPPGFLAALRETTRQRGIVLIFDEVVTGFRVSPGGAQAHCGITPDIATLAKILGGGLPSGALAGRTDILDLLDFQAAKARGVEKIAHQGTFNANPLSAAAGIAALEIIRSTDICERAGATAETLRGRINRVFADAGMAWAAYGEFSSVYIFTNPEGLAIDPLTFNSRTLEPKAFHGAGGHPAAPRLRLALLLGGVDFSSKPGGIVSAVHDDADIEITAEAFRAAIAMLRDEGALV